MRVLFVYPNHIGDTQIRMGIAYLSAYLKKFGHETALLDLTFGWNKDETVKMIRDFKLISSGFPCSALNLIMQ